MAVSYRIDKSLGLIFTTPQGMFTGQDMLTHIKRLTEDPDFDPSYNQLVDLRAVIEFAMSAAELQVITGYRLFNEKSRRAIVADKDITFGMARMYEVFREDAPEEIKLFRDMAEARRWLGLD